MILANVFHRPVRTVVSVLAVAIEVVLILAVVGLTQGLLRNAAKRVEGVGAQIMVQPPGASLFLGLTAAPMPIKIAGLIKQLPRVQQVAPVLLQFNPSSGGLSVIYGINMTSFNQVSGGFVYLSGGPLRNEWDVLTDNTYADANHVKVGDTIRLLNHDFHVCGIVEHGKGGRLFIRISTAQELVGATNRANLFFVKCTNPSFTPEVLASIRKLLPGYQVLSVREYMSMITSDKLPALTDFVRAIIGVAVSIGFLIIFLSMYSTIHERTREIGILKSLGASKVYLVRAILNEAVLMATVGIAVGYGGVYLVIQCIRAYFPMLTILLTPDWAVRAAALALAGALIGAFYPALRAASLDPVDALAYE